MTKSHQAKPWWTPASNYFSIGSCQRDDPRQSNMRLPGMELASNPDECSPQINVRLGRKIEKALAAAAFEVVPCFVAKLMEPWPTPAANYFSIDCCQRDDPRQVRKTVQYGMEPTSNPGECSSRINVKLGRSGKALAAAAFEVVPALLWKGSFVVKLIGLHLPLLEESVLWVGVIIPTLGRGTNLGWLNVSYLFDVV
ncbi:hypothetical protein CDAR_248591 [Caerostris darwini]|uniref:Uncharacterized protein n=1 Tax=Caerostris darwini TaxID=1538125 RepID=A0AAV4RJD7_9ARAC|nr:hypothetical protein CDAR_248591 [Caerostris darwini]